MRNAGRVLPRKLIEEKLYTPGRRGLQQRRGSSRPSSAPQARQRLYPYRPRHRLYPRVTHETTCPPEPAPAPDAAVCRTDHRRLGEWPALSPRQQTSKKLDKLFDTQQLLFARRLSVMHFDELRAPPALLGGKEKGTPRAHRRRRAGVRHLHPRRQNGA